MLGTCSHRGQSSGHMHEFAYISSGKRFFNIYVIMDFSGVYIYIFQYSGIFPGGIWLEHTYINIYILCVKSTAVLNMPFLVAMFHI